MRKSIPVHDHESVGIFRKLDLRFRQAEGSDHGSHVVRKKIPSCNCSGRTSPRGSSKSLTTAKETCAKGEKTADLNDAERHAGAHQKAKASLAPSVESRLGVPPEFLKMEFPKAMVLCPLHERVVTMPTPSFMNG